ncbi:MAG: hypothetical protein QW283_00205, partial [Thermoplasmata archaeon]
MVVIFPEIDIKRGTRLATIKIDVQNIGSCINPKNKRTSPIKNISNVLSIKDNQIFFPRFSVLGKISNKGPIGSMIIKKYIQMSLVTRIKVKISIDESRAIRIRNSRNPFEA